MIAASTAIHALSMSGHLMLLPFDPSSYVQSNYTSWIGPAQNIARTIYMALIIFDFIALAITTLLFRENLGEFFSSIAFKVLLGGVFFFLISNGPTLSSDVIQYLKNSSTSFGGNPAVGPDLVIGELVTIGVLCYSTAGVASSTAALEAPLEGIMVYGNGFPGLPMSTIVSPVTFSLGCQALGLIVILGAIGIALQFMIVTIESYLVMSVGTLMIGFAGSKFTFPFSQGYFSYMINVGIKLMVTYIILGAVASGLLPALFAASAGLAIAVITPAAGIAALGAMALAAAYVLLALGVVWTIPAFTAALLTGQSQSSGAAILQQAMGSIAGATAMMAQMGMAARSAAAGNGGIDHASGGSAVAGAGSHEMARGHMNDQFASNGAVSAVGSNGGATGGIGHMTGSGGGPTLYDNAYVNGSNGSGLGSSAPMNPMSGASYGPGLTGASGPSLASVNATDIGKMQSGEFNERYRNTNLGDLSDKQLDAIRSSDHLADARRIDAERSAVSKEQEALALGYGLQGASQAVGRDIGQPSAVQVRISNPDKS